ncbi:aspartate:alanine exchanger family transporter [Geochorda subterranea]|uniref:Aspartate:alanine exchanger family transporter n=1 Tax=Geochorda subterranea TaxID=3109564 RepID=A0ABZ1BTD9_9FIRM|nr:aspartate:alanine exchanger family transporter [Limnochorda sp. LNt]WRP15448.1 aspartate:alanine exchanger family transporter [Limnochorda sp. LNt]
MHAESLVRLLADNPLLLLFVVAGLGYLLGSVRVGRLRLGAAAVLFVGLAVGAVDRRLALPEIVYQFGLVVFVYTMGLSSGPGFVASLRGRGVRDTGFALAVLTLTTALTWGVGRMLGLPPELLAGLYTGSLTHTPALAAVIETLQAAGRDAVALPTLGYSLAYPVGVVGVIGTMAALARLWRVDYREESRRYARASGAPGSDPVTATDVVVTRPEVTDVPVAELWQRLLARPGAGAGRVVASRLTRDGRQQIVTGQTRLALGDVVTLVGAEEDLRQVASRLGEPSAVHPEYDRSQLEMRRIFVSNRQVAGRRLRDLRLQTLFGATVTRVKRGDVDLVPAGDTVLELGDRVRVVAPRDRLPEVARLLGDSFRDLSEIDIPSVSLGVAMGLLVGLVPIPLPGGLTLRLGFAGGPLLVALILGTLGRTGPIVWVQPHNANLTLRQLGLVLFMAGIGTRSGHAFWSTLIQAGPAIVAGAATVTLAFAVGTLVVGYRLLGIPMPLLGGMLAGLQTQPAALAFASDQSGDDLPALGYAAVYPTAMLVKILLAQLLLR